LTVAPAPPQLPVSVPAGATVHIPLDPATPADTEVTLTDTTNSNVLVDEVVRFCILVNNISVTIKAGATYTLTNLLSNGSTRPLHGTTVRIGYTAIRYTPIPCFSGTDHFSYTDFIQAVEGVVTVTVLPGSCRVTVSRTATDCASRSVVYTATNPYALPATIREAGPNGPSNVTDFVVPAHTTKVIHRLTFDPTHPNSEPLSFRLLDPLVTLFTDTVVFPCPAGAGGAQVPLAATGPAVAGQLGWGAGAVTLGVLLTWLGRRRSAGMRAG
jgi:hypothetical protein